VATDDGHLGVVLVSFSSLGDQAHQKSMYVPVLRAHPALRLVAVADEASAPADLHALNAREADALGLPYIADLDAALADPRVDMACVCCPFDRRVAVLERVAAAGKHALVDKPLALDLAECDAIERRFGPDLLCMPAQHYRFHPAIRSARAAVAGGSIGLPWAAHGEFMIAEGTAAWPPGELLNFGVYAVDALRAVLGLEIRSVYATVQSAFYDGADDFSVLALTFEHGVVATTSVGRAPTTGHPDGYGGERRLRVMGSHGTLIVDAGSPGFTVHGDGRSTRRFFGASSLRALVDHFIGAARGEHAPELSVRDARAALEVVLAARTSAAEKRVVQLQGGSA
jgi:myo-inositol 2-dehydrogenase / D-chiro-inositol 1-dehydrogenase